MTQYVETVFRQDSLIDHNQGQITVPVNYRKVEMGPMTNENHFTCRRNLKI